MAEGSVRPPTGRRMLGLSVLAAGVAVLALAPEAVFLSFGGVVLACGLSVPARWVAARIGGSIAWGTALVCLALTAAFAGLAVIVGGNLMAQLRDLATEIPRIGQQIEDALGSVGLSWVAGRTGAIAQEAPQTVSSAVQGVVQAVGACLVLAFLAFYLAYQPRLYRESFLQVVPAHRRERARRVLEEVGDTLAWWLLGRLVGMVVVGVLVSASLALLGMPMPLALGLVAGLLDFVPNVGPIVAALPAVLVVASEGPERILLVGAIYSAVQVFEAYVVTPLIERRTASVPPALVIVAQLVFGLLFGAVGLAFATPAVAAGLVLVRQLWLEEALGEPRRRFEE